MIIGHDDLLLVELKSELERRCLKSIFSFFAWMAIQSERQCVPEWQRPVNHL